MRPTTHVPAIPAAAARDEAGPLRRLLLALVVLGATGLLAELLLLEHWEPGWQLVPLALLALVLATALPALLRPGAPVLRALRAVLALCVLAGAAGVLLHFRGNVEWELEREAALGGWALFAEAARGATPALAPGALAQLGLLGLIALWRHPALLASPSTPHSPQEPT